MKKLLMLTLIFTASTSFLHSADAQQDPKVAVLTPLFKAIFSSDFEAFQKSYESAPLNLEEKDMLKAVASTKLAQVTQALAQADPDKIKIKPKQDKAILQTAGLEQIIAFLS